MINSFDFRKIPTDDKVSAGDLGSNRILSLAIEVTPGGGCAYSLGCALTEARESTEGMIHGLTCSDGLKRLQLGEIKVYPPDITGEGVRVQRTTS